MKKKLMLSVALSTVVLGTMAPLGYAAVTTTGEAGFEVNTDEWAIVKPKEDHLEADEVIIPSDKSTYENVSNVHLMHVPKFKFGTNNKISPNSISYNALHEGYKAVDATTGAATGTEMAIPQFVQVGDASGEIGTKWSVVVIQEDYFKNGSHELENTTVKLNGATLMNNLKATTNVINGLVATTAAPKEIGIKTAGPGVSGLEVLARDGSVPASNVNSTNGTKSSVVFKTNYKEADYGIGSSIVLATDRNSDVQLVVPQGENPTANVYATTFTWTLSVTP